MITELKRNLKITPSICKKTIKVYNGKEFHQFLVLPKMIGYKIGDFSLTKKKVIHKTKNK